MTIALIQHLKNSVQHYHWGTTDAISQILNRPELNTGEAVAEYWIGTHPAAPSLLRDRSETLSDYLQHQGQPRNLPYLLKLLSAGAPLSIQVHPNKRQAETGFAAEQAAGLSISASNRNYKDDNHKPETIFALTPFQALCGFRTKEAISADIERLNVAMLSNKFADLQQSDIGSLLQSLMQWLFALEQAELTDLIDAVLNCGDQAEPVDATMASLFAVYQYDAGVLMPLLLNVLTLQPGESMFLAAGIPHAYLSGTGVEVMATSDNVLRAGLTPKHVDIPELLKIVEFAPYAPVIEHCDFSAGIHSMTVPIADYQLDYVVFDGSTVSLPQANRPQLWLVIKGKLEVSGAELLQGDSVVVCNTESATNVSGTGEMVRVY